MADIDIQELTRTLDSSRKRLSHHGRNLKEKANIPKRISKSVRTKPAPWIAGAAVIGVLLAIRATRPKRVEYHPSFTVQKPVVEKKSLLLSLLFSTGKLAFPFLKPVLMGFLSRKNR